MIQIIGLIISSLSLMFAITWYFWNYRKQRSRIKLYLNIAIISIDPSKVKFTPLGNKFKNNNSRSKAKLVLSYQTSISVRVHNIGNNLLTIESFFVCSKTDKKQIKIGDIWLLVEEDYEKRLPFVLHPGKIWEGFIDWYPLKVELMKIYGDVKLWDLTLTCKDVNSKIYKSNLQISDKIINDIIKSID